MEFNKPVTICILLIITGMMFFLFAWPKYEEFREARITLAKKEAELSGESDYYAKVEKLTVEIDARKDILAKIDDALPTDALIAPMIHFFQKSGVESGLIIKAVTFTNSNASAAPPIGNQALKRDVKEIAFMVNMTGNYRGLKTFLIAIEKSARLFEVDTIALAPLQSLQNPSQVQNYDIKLQIKTHTY